MNNLKTLDNLTPTFQAKMYSLSRQQQKIVDVLSDCNDGLIVKEIAASSRSRQHQASFAI